MDVSVLGRIGYDLYSDQPGIPLKDVRSFSRYLGGSSANIAVGLSRLGLKVGMISCVGEDDLGEYLLDYLRRESVCTELVAVRPDCQSSLCLTGISPPSFPQVFYRQGAADTQVRAGNLDKEFIAATRLFVTNGTSLCASPARESTFHALEWAHQNGVRVAFDVDYRSMSWKSPREAGLYARLALPFIDVFIGNPEELLLVAERQSTDDAIRRISASGVSTVVAKLGSEGVKVSGEEGFFLLPPYPAQVASTIGAGDGFAAGFLYALAHQYSLKTALKYGNAAAALVVSRVMCSEAMPNLTEIQALIEKHPEVEVRELPR
ncbi:MAG: 5-dehydro-2-deoxygluconokinase [Acidobacteriota bacterium]